MSIERLGCSTITFRYLGLERALDTIGGLGFAEVDLGSLPGVCEHVPTHLTSQTARSVAEVVRRSGMTVRSVNGDIGDLNSARLEIDASEQLDRLIALAAEVGSRALVLPNGALDHNPIDDLGLDLDRVADNLGRARVKAAEQGIELWTESLHVYRLCCTLDRAAALTSRLDPAIGIVMDFSHIVAAGADPVRFVELFGERIVHVHIRDATVGRVELETDPPVDEPGNINLSVGRGSVEFAVGIGALESASYSGHYTLELETRDVSDDERPAATADAARVIRSVLSHTPSIPHATS